VRISPITLFSGLISALICNSAILPQGLLSGNEKSF
jgi:hypothetical protein